MADEHGRRGSEDYEELARLLLEADGFLENEDLRWANETLKKAGVKAASMWGEVGQPALPAHTVKLVGLLWEVQQDLCRPGQGSPTALRKDLRQLRCRFEIEASREAEQITVGKRRQLDDSRGGTMRALRSSPRAFSAERDGRTDDEE